MVKWLVFEPFDPFSEQKKNHSFFGQNVNKKICFWNLLTFIHGIFSQNHFLPFSGVSFKMTLHKNWVYFEDMNIMVMKTILRLCTSNFLLFWTVVKWLMSIRWVKSGQWCILQIFCTDSRRRWVIISTFSIVGLKMYPHVGIILFKK